MNNNKYFDDLKNLKPLPLDKIPRPEVRNQKSEKQIPKQLEEVAEKSTVSSPQSAVKENSKILTEISTMEKLNNSKTLWGFGIAVIIYILQNILITLNVVGPDNIIMKSIIEAVIAIAGFFGVYGIRDALRKMTY